MQKSWFLEKLVLDNRGKGWYSREDNKEGRVHPPHLQQREEVYTADGVPERGACVRAGAVHPRFCFVCYAAKCLRRCFGY